MKNFTNEELDFLFDAFNEKYKESQNWDNTVSNNHEVADILLLMSKILKLQKES